VNTCYSRHIPQQASFQEVPYWLLCEHNLIRNMSL
jgi:hypothetical protein